jgi:exoribonuclease-2
VNDLEVVWFERKGGLRLGAVTGGGEKRAVLVDEDGSSVRVPRHRVLHSLRRRLPAGAPQALKQELRRLRAGDDDAPDPVDHELLWSSLEDEVGYSLGELAQLVYGAEDDRAVGALVRSLGAPDSSRLAASFRLAKGRVLRVDPALRAQLVERERREAAERSGHEAFSSWYAAWREAGQGPPGPPPSPEVGRLLDLLRAYALEGTHATHAKAARRLARHLGCPDPDELLAELEASGALPRHVNELPHRSGLTRSFSAAAEEEAAALADRAPPAEEDWTHVPTVAVDDPSTTEVDDAISAWVEGETTWLAVHIANVADYVPPGGALDREAQRRATSTYFPAGVWTMLPPQVSPLLGLEPGSPRSALSLICPVGPDGLPGPGRFVRARVQVDLRATYEDPPPPVAREVLERLTPVARALRETRRAAGAMAFSLAPVKVGLDAQGEPEIHVASAEGIANEVVSELMVLYNARLAQALAEARRPGLFRSQPQEPQTPAVGPEHPLFRLVARRSMLPTRVGVKPAPHRPMGVEAYVQGTSPLRRLGDLLAQRQLLSVLDDVAAPYDGKTLDDLRQAIHKRERMARSLEEERRRYWVCRWLQNRAGERLQAVVSREGRQPMAYLPALARELPLADHPPPPPVETRVEVSVLEADPRQRHVVLAVAGEPD